MFSVPSIFISFFILSLMLVPSPAHADDAFLYLPVSPILISYVETATGYKLPPHMRIGVVDNDAPLLSTHNVVVPGMSISADAAEKRGDIYLPVYNAVRLQEPNIQALIVHELTHVAQETNGRHYACDDQREAEAYSLQNKFLRDEGLPPILDNATLTAFGQCRRL